MPKVEIPKSKFSSFSTFKAVYWADFFFFTDFHDELYFCPLIEKNAGNLQSGYSMDRYCEIFLHFEATNCTYFCRMTRNRTFTVSPSRRTYNTDTP